MKEQPLIAKQVAQLMVPLLYPEVYMDAHVRSLSPWAILPMYGTGPILTKLFKACAMIVVLIPFYDILISSKTRHKAASNSHALNYLLTYTMTDIYLLMGLKQWGQSLWNLGEIKKT